MAHIGLSVISLLLSLLSAAAIDVESSFLENRPDLLLLHLSFRSGISLSLPEPISFSDQISPEQSYFLFQGILARFQTQEFFSESDLPGWLDKDRLILKARWSFRDTKTNNQCAFRLFILFKLEKLPARASGPSAGEKDSLKRSNPWKIIEIKAEKI